ncbi:GNAT family N-acetyltransferase [Alginatibacterium sediminis]|uniref:GNAT family N-acetyltransferase n=1 Tax=Alginatibacterium sediminis TaxID=2164068 RepID=A0A420E893_9ALTE|nr:GNAT family N-acetyltransferase [Alginatibacterium sediminis]RKF15600.1 GNAT family N-acetyltransferase [Alginatibacterium sediminis]
MYDTKNSETKSQKQVQSLICTAKVEHAPDIVSIQRASWRHAYPKPLIDALLSNLPISVHRQMWAERVQSQQLKTVVIFDTQTELACGFAMYELQNMSCEVHALYLPPKHIGHGYGRSLLEFIKETAGAAYCSELRLWVMEDNSEAIGFYQHLGLNLCGVTQVQKHFGKAYRKCLMNQDLLSV